MMSEPKLETRTFPFEARVEGSQDESVLVGYAMKWLERSEPMPFVERFLPGAFTKDLTAGRDVLALVGHDLSKVVARRSNNTLELHEDDRGLRVEIKPNTDTTHGKDVVALVKRRDVLNMSIGFYAVKDRWVEDGDTLIREVVEAELREVSIVSLPAYTGTSVTTRKENLTVEERNKTVATAEENVETTETTENQETTNTQAPPEERQAPRIEPVLSTPAHESRGAFASYLRGQPFDVRQLTVSPATAGGYLAPETFVAELIKALNEASVMRKVADVRGPIAAASVRFPVLESSVTAKWTPEAQAIETSDAVFAQVEFTPHQLAAMTMASNELLGDSAIDVEGMLAELFGEEFATVEDAAFFSGTGSGQPTGILTNTDIPTVEAGAEDEITADDVLALYDALPAQYRGGAVWIMHHSTMGMLRRLKDDSGQYLLVAGLASGAPTTLLGRPVYLTSHMPEVGAEEKTILFGDLKRAYRIVDRMGIDVQRSADRYFEQDLTAFRAIKRVDAKVVLPDAARFLVQAEA